MVVHDALRHPGDPTAWLNSWLMRDRERSITKPANVFRTVFIGDSPTDVRTARHAGVTMVGVTWGFRPGAELRAAGAVHLVDTVAGLAPWLE